MGRIHLNYSNDTGIGQQIVVELLIPAFAALKEDPP